LAVGRHMLEWMDSNSAIHQSASVANNAPSSKAQHER